MSRRKAGTRGDRVVRTDGDRGVVAGLGVAYADQWRILSGTLGVASVLGAFAVLGRRVEAGPTGLRFRTVLRWHRLEWEEIVRFEDVRVAAADHRFHHTHLRVAAQLRALRRRYACEVKP